MKTADKIRTAAARIAGYTVTGAGFTARHHTLTLRAALEWATCYPAATITRRGRFVASKTIR